MTSRKKLILTSVAIALFLSSALAMTAYYFWRNFEDNGGVAGLLERRLNDEGLRVNSVVSETKLNIDWSLSLLQFEVSKVKLSTENSTITLPVARFDFDWSDVLRGNVTPSGISLTGLNLKFVHGGAGWEQNDVLALLATIPSQSESYDIEHIQINDATVTILKQNAAQNKFNRLDWRNINADFTLQDGAIKGKLDIAGVDGSRASFDILQRSDEPGIQLSTTLDKIDLAKIYPYLGIEIPELSQIGITSGTVEMALTHSHSQNLHLVKLNGDLRTEAGKIKIESFGDPINIAFGSADLSFVYDAKQDFLNVSDFNMGSIEYLAGNAKGSEFYDGQISLNGEIRELLTATPLVDVKLKSRDLPLQVFLRNWRTKAEGPSQIDQALQWLEGGNVISAGIDITGVIDRKVSNFKINFATLTVELTDIGLTLNEDVLKQYGVPVEHLSGVLDARLELALSGEGALENAAADIVLRQAELKMSGQSSHDILEKIQLKGHLYGSVIHLTHVAIDAKSLEQLIFQGELAFDKNWQPHRFDVKVVAEHIDQVFLENLWPQRLLPKVHAWIQKNVVGGQINNFQLNGGFDLTSRAKTPVIYLDGKAELEGAVLMNVANLPAVKDVDVDIDFTEKGFNGNVKKAKVNSVDLSGSRLILRRGGDDFSFDAAIFVAGDLADASLLIERSLNERIEIVNILKEGELGGTFSGSVGLNGYISEESANFTDINFAFQLSKASLHGVKVESLPYDFTLAEADMELLFTDGDLSIAGRGKIVGAESVFNINYKEDGTLNSTVTVKNSEAFTALVAKSVGLDLGGAMGGEIELTHSPKSGQLNIHSAIDFSDTSLHFAKLGLTKLPGDAAQFSADFILNNGSLQAVNNIMVDGDFLSADGQISFDESGEFLGAYFEHIAWLNNNFNNVTATKNVDGILHIEAKAEYADLRPLRREENFAQEIAFNLSLTANQIQIDDRVMLSGHMQLFKGIEGNGIATFLGELSFSDGFIISESRLDARFGDKEIIEGSGLIGGVEASFVMASEGGIEGDSMMKLRSNNGGQILKALNITDAIRSGELLLDARFPSFKKGYGVFIAKIKNFNITEAPKSVKFLSFLSPAGLYSLVEGDGVNFAEGQAKVEFSEDKVVIHHARAKGDALAFDVVGVIDQDNHLDISGNLLPIYTFTKILGQIPIISEIFTGKDNEGLFVTQFKVAGTTDNPVTGINASSILPGIFRDVFSPDWVEKERERLLN